ncbi:MAG: hypothetical protein AAGF12_01315 [Myxococcota bacterium]
MSQERVQLIGAYPIPMGHRVEVTWYQAEEMATSFLGQDKKKVEKIDAPVLVDVDTGVRYGLLAHFDEGSGYYGGRINIEQHTLRSNLVPIRSLKGTVVSCSIAQIRFEGRGFEQDETELVIETGDR